MSEHERGSFPDWAEEERPRDLVWIKENLDVFWTVSTDAFEEVGRGAIFVDTTAEPVPDMGNPFAYFSQEQVEEFGNDDTRRMVTEYDPAQELVLVLLKSGDRASTYRLQFVSPDRQSDVDGEAATNLVAEPVAEPELKPPDVETLIEWEAEGGCEAACPHHCWVEPDGTCPHGNPSWLRRLGLV